MKSYNATQDEGYKISNNYSSTKQTQVLVYEGSQAVQISLPIYQEKQQQSSTRKSKCPRGAILNKIGSCCGDQCTRACAIEG